MFYGFVLPETYHQSTGSSPEKLEMSSGGAHSLTVDREFHYIVQWFTEWSDFQREDFVPVVASYLAKTSPAGGPVYVNGIISGMAKVTGQDKPMSLFQCRVKLFNEWTAKWPESQRDKLLERLGEIDPKFARHVQQELTDPASSANQPEDKNTPAFPGDPVSPHRLSLASTSAPLEASETSTPEVIALVMGED